MPICTLHNHQTYISKLGKMGPPSSLACQTLRGIAQNVRLELCGLRLADIHFSILLGANSSNSKIML